MHFYIHRLLKLYNSHFTGSCTWNLGSKSVLQLCKSWNSNLRVIFKLPVQTHCWIIENISGGCHLKQMLFRRFVKFVGSIDENRRNGVRALLNITKNNVQSVTGGNLRRILLETDIKVVPGQTKPSMLQCHTVYKTPEDKEWLIPLLTSLLEIRDERWQLIFDEESEDGLLFDHISETINQLCID